MEKIKDYFENPELLDSHLEFHLKKENIIYEESTKKLIKAHIEKAKHNLRTADLLISNREYNDWAVISLYYALYHSCLALLAKKGYSSKNHTSTLLFIIKNYSDISKEEIEMIDKTQLTKSDAEFYTSLKQDRHDASYSTESIFTSESINYLRKKNNSFLK
jgi:uncharacterized protein (UPF0332 family)